MGNFFITLTHLRICRGKIKENLLLVQCADKISIWDKAPIFINIEAAIKTGLIDDNNIFISEEEASLIPKENIVIICTGSQGEKRSALYRIAYNSHRHIHLEKDDVVIFSSRDIPGNEKSINGLKNLLIIFVKLLSKLMKDKLS